MNPFERVFVALDTTDLDSAIGLARELVGRVGGVKIGKEFFTALGPRGVQIISEIGIPIFIDLKWHDIPNTVVGAVRASLSLKPAFINVHATGGSAMLRAAVDAAAEVGSERPLVLAVTVLTSLDNSDLDSIGIKSKTIDQVALLARLAEENGLDGVVCSPQEISVLRKVCHPDFLLMVPGVRPVWAASGDQKRTMTPNEAFNHGADYLVIGRPITENKNPVKALELIVQELV